jgi:hypothetical protein
VSIQQQQQIKQLVAKAAVIESEADTSAMSVEVPLHLPFKLQYLQQHLLLHFHYSSVTTAEAANKAAVTKVEATAVIVIAALAVIEAAINTTAVTTAVPLHITNKAAVTTALPTATIWPL